MRGESGNKPESFHGREKARRRLRGPPLFYRRLSQLRVPCTNFSPAPSPRQRPTQDARPRCPIGSVHEAARSITCRADPKPPRRVAPPSRSGSSNGAAGSPSATSSSRPAPPRLWAGPERSGFRFPLSCLAVSGNGSGMP